MKNRADLLNKYTKLLLSLLMMLTCVNFTTTLAEGEQESTATSESEMTNTSVDYSESIYYSLDYNEEKTSATLTIGVSTEDAVTLDFENNDELTSNIDAGYYALNEESSNDKSYVFAVKENGTYNFNAQVFDDTETVVGSKEFTIDVNELVASTSGDTIKETSNDQIMLVDDEQTETTIEVGKSLVLTGHKNAWSGCNFEHTWTIASGDDVVSVSGTGYTAFIKGLAVGTAKIIHEYCSVTYAHNGTDTYLEHWEVKEVFNITVTEASQTETTKKVFVYIAKANYDSNTLSALGVKTDKVDNNGYIPIGEIELPDSYFEGKTGSIYSDSTPLIQTEEDWTKVVAAVKNMNTLTLTGNYTANIGNHVSSYISSAIGDLNEKWNSGHTSLFYCSSSSTKGSQAFDGKTDWNLVLYFNTNTIQYVLGNDIEGSTKGTTLYTQTYVSGTNAVEPTFTIFDDYRIAGFYSDEEMTTPWSAADTTVTENKTVYVKATKRTNTLIQYKAIGGGTLSLDEESFYPDDETYKISGSTAKAKDKYQFVGWYDDASCTDEHLVTTEATLTPTKPSTGWPESMTYYAKFKYLYSRVTINCYWVGDTAETKTLIATPYYTEGEIGKELTIEGKDYDGIFSYSVKENQQQTITVSENASENVVSLYYYRSVILQANGTKNTVFKYDGQEHEVTGFISYLPNDVIKKTDLGLTFAGLSASGKGTEANSKTPYVVEFNQPISDIEDKLVDSTGYYKVNKAHSGEFWILNAVDVSASSLNKTYNGKPLTTTAYATPSAGTLVEYSYSSDNGTNWSDWSTEKPSITNVGKLNVKVKATNENYAEGTCEYTLEVTKKEVTITAVDTKKVYGTKDPEFTATISGLVDGESPEINYSLSREAGEDVNTYTITPTTSTTLENYTITCKPGTFTITKSNAMTLTPELTGSKATKAYDGKALKGGAIASVEKGTTITYSIDNEKTWSREVPSITNIGTLNVVAKATNPNYEDVTVRYTLTVTEPSSSTPTPTSGWDDGGPFTTDTCGNVFDRWGNKIYEAKGCNVGGYNLVQTGTKD